MKNNNKTLVVLVIILSILVLALSGYLIYDKLLSNNGSLSNSVGE